MAMTVLDALVTEGFWGASILAGWQGLRQEVQTVTVAEVPDAANWLEGGEIVLTTGYFFRDKPDRFAAWIESLARSGAVAVAVKRKRFLGDVPEQAVSVMEQLGVPLVSLRHRVAWPTIISPVLQRQHALAGEREMAWWKEELHRMLEGRRGLPTAAQTLATLTGLPVLLQGPNLELLAAGVPQDGAWPGEVRWDLWLKRRASTRTVTRLREELARRRAESSVEPWKLEGYPIEVEEGWAEHFYPLTHDEREVGYLSLLHPGVEVTPEQRYDWQYAAAVISLAFQRFVQAGERHLSQTARALLAALTSDDAVELPRGVAESLETPGVLVAVRLEREGAGRSTVSDPEPGPGVVDVLLRDLQSWHRGHHPQGLVTYHKGVFYFLLPSGQPGENTPAPGELRRRQQRWLEALERFLVHKAGRGRLVAGFSETGAGRDFYRQAFLQSQDSLRLADDGIGEVPVAWYEDLGVLRLVARAGSPGFLQTYVEQYLGPLMQEEEQIDGECYLLETLRAFFAHDGNLTRTAEHLFIHRNTLRYRLKRIEELTGLDVFTSNGQATLFVAMRLLGFLENGEPKSSPPAVDGLTGSD